MTQTVTQDQILQWLQTGAVLQTPAGELWIWPDLVPAKQNQDKSITYMDFYGSKIGHFGSAGGPQKVDPNSLKRALHSLVEEHLPEFRQGDFQEPTLEDFQKDFQEVQGKIQRGEIEKAVPVVFAKADKAPTPKERARWILNLLSQPGEQYVYGLWRPEEGFVGATPELLFMYQQGSLTSMALAGTCPRAEIVHRLPLLKDPKELREHEIVAKDLRERLAKWGYVQKGETQVLELPSLLHLKTSFQVACSQPAVEDLLKALHPTPALGVSPRNYGISWMKKLNSQEGRGVFGAPLTFDLGEEGVISVVCIRNIIWSANETRVGSGCGLVSGSELQREFDELKHKRRAVYLSLGIDS